MSRSDPPADATPQETTSRTVVGLFDRRPAAEAAIRALRDAGFAEDRIGVAVQEHGGTLVTVDAGPRTAEALALLARHDGDRRAGLDPAYAGPERRLVGV